MGMNPKIRRTHDLALILQDETPVDERPNERLRPSTERSKHPSLIDKPLQPLPIPSVNILGDQSKSHQPRYSYNMQHPIPPAYSLTKAARMREVELPSSSPSSNAMKVTPPDNWNNRMLGRRTRSQVNLLPVGSPMSETSQPPSKVRVTETPKLPILRPISGMNVRTVHPFRNLWKNSVRLCRPLPESNSQSPEAISLLPPPIAEPNNRKHSSIRQSPDGQVLRPQTLHQDFPPLSSHVNFPRFCGSASRCIPALNRLPSFQHLTQSLENDDASHDPNTEQPVTPNLSQLRPDCPPRAADPKLEDDGHRSKNGGHSSPARENGTVNPGMMYVNNMVQNVRVPSQTHRQKADAQPHHRPQVPQVHNSMPESFQSKTQHHNIQTPFEEDGRIYDLAKIRQAGLTVISGRVYNQQNHPMCAAPRENGIPCKRNVSRSACRWHGSVRVLTPHNTMNGLLDNFGNLAHVDTSFNENVHSSGVPSSASGQPRILSADAPVLRLAPRVVARSLRWNNEEHYWFLLGLQRYGHRWSTISKVVRTRDTLQVQSHAQKYFERQSKVDKKKSTIHDLRIDGIELSEVAAKYTAEEIHRRVNLIDANGIRIESRSNAAPS